MVIILLPLFCVACTAENNTSSGTSASVAEQKTQKQDKIVDLDILCVGDIMVHTPQIAGQYIATEDRYDYTNNYKYVKPYVESADLAICNVETTFAGKPYLGYPLFAAPNELADAIKYAGFDVAGVANNHMNDRGSKGIFGTQEVLRERGLKVTGSRPSVEAQRFAMNKVKGVKIATIAYTYETTASSGVALNGIQVPPECENLINSFSYLDLDRDLASINDTVKLARKEGADIVVMFMHWGEEYQPEPNGYQQQIADYLVKQAKVDIIFGSHPHVPQKLDRIDNTPIYYSLGNYISNQRMETLGNSMTEIGIMAKVDLKYNITKKELVEIEPTAIPTWVERYRQGGKLVYEIIPLDEKLAENPTLQKTGDYERASAAYKKVAPLITLK